jgi:hypothetical protein
VFNIGETVLFWKRMPTGIPPQGRAKGPRIQGGKGSNKWMGCNTNRNYELKPVIIYHADNSRSLEGISQILPSCLLAIYKEGLDVRPNIH